MRSLSCFASVALECEAEVIFVEVGVYMFAFLERSM